MLWPRTRSAINVITMPVISDEVKSHCYQGRNIYFTIILPLILSTLCNEIAATRIILSGVTCDSYPLNR